MKNDEQEIRALIAQWLTASKAGDTATVLELMSEDAVFLLPGRPPMRGKKEFAAAMPPASGATPAIDGQPNIQEVQVMGDWAYTWNDLTVTITPAGKEPIVRRGPVLTIFRRESGRWRLYRDANLLTPVVPGTK